MTYSNMDNVPTQTAGTSELLASDWNTYVRDNFDSIKFGHIVCTSSTRPTGIAEGTMIYETDTNYIYVYNGSSWIFVNNVNVGTTATTVPYSYVDTVYFTSSGTFSKGSYSWLRAINVKVQGAGGGGGGTTQPTVGQGGTGRNGGGGAYAESFITDIAGLASSVTVTVGAAGTGGANTGAAGGAGGNSSFGTAVTADGGYGGGGAYITGNAFVLTFQTGTSGRGSIVGTGDLVVPGGSGNPTFVISAGESTSFGGGNSVLGNTRRQHSTDGGAFGMDGFAGGGYGAGGNAALSAQNAGARAGGAGAPGIVIVELFA